jgi:hypothetical protein
MTFATGSLRFPAWIWSHRRTVATVSTIIGFLVGLAFHISDAYSKTDASLSSVASDPNDPFLIPFSAASSSHLWNVSWTCTIDFLQNNKYILVRDGITGSDPKSPRKAEIWPNVPLNVDCTGFRLPPPFVAGRILIELSYDASVIFFPIHRAPPPTEFNLYRGQWIKGKSLNAPPKATMPRLQWDDKTQTVIVVPERQ